MAVNALLVYVAAWQQGNAMHRSLYNDPLSQPGLRMHQLKLSVRGWRHVQ
jgi:hypothetical protein